MPLVTWNEEYSVNNDELDDHHRQLIAILNALYEECLKVDSEGCVGPKIDELLAYTGYHFRAEEQYMRQIQYFEIDDHIEMHSGFTFKLEELKRLSHGDQLELTRNLIVYVGKWLLHHVLEEDRKYAAHAAKGGRLLA